MATDTPDADPVGPSVIPRRFGRVDHAPLQVAREPLHPEAVRRHALAVLERTLAIMTAVPDRILTHGVAVSCDGEARHRPSAPDAWAFSPMALVERLTEQRFFAAEPVRWHMQLAVFDMIDIAAGEVAARLCAEDARLLAPKYRLDRGVSWQDALRPDLNRAHACLQQVHGLLSRCDAIMRLRLQFGASATFPYRPETYPKGVELIDLAAEVI